MPTTPEEDAVKSADEPAADATVPAPEAAPALRKRHGNGPVFFVIGAVFAILCSIGWGYAVMNYTGMGGGAYHQIITSSAPSASQASITYEVNSRGGAVCLIRALDERLVEVGQKTVATEPGNHMVSTTVETVRQAATVEVASCREQGSQD